MESVKIMYLPAEVITADHHALNHSPDKIYNEDSKAVVINFAIVKNDHELTAPFYDELHFANYE